ncbi:hydroxymethylbilane synthase [Rubellimicrobium roseum]|uniref:Porphobilinogen deaminase n=1 Tax=Rubellimicrobium roseum TaxID=687525 RepID=A0A5C4N846_9RHOB|nr:hydroxymethylbilane synthase [Rubellimicrobium roseum]TNC63897.1 hydroxymethylbilane synthase [Rubellimicrobium roseum]
MTQAPLRIGTRGSPLALAQAHETRARLMAATGLPEDAFEIVVIRVTGDAVQDRPLSQIGGKGLFTKEIEEALLAGDVDLAVHSMKDMPVAQPEGLSLDCYLPREDPRDAFVTLTEHAGLADLPEGAVVGTSSLRRRAQLLARRPDLRVVEFRGNVQTRLSKLAQGVAEATFLAMAGMNRLGYADVPARPIPPDAMLPAIAQGAIGVERRTDDARVAEMLALIHDRDTGLRLAAERAFLAGLDGSCQTPIAGLAEIEGDRLRLRGEILQPDGSRVMADDCTGPLEEGADIGGVMACRMRREAGPDFFAAWS